MKKRTPALALALFALGTCQTGLAAVSKVSGNGEGATREEAEAKARKNLETNCESFGGTVVAGSLEVTFDKPLSNGQQYVDATMECDIP